MPLHNSRYNKKFTKKYKKVTYIYDEHTQNLYIQSQKSDYMGMKISLNDNQTSENV